MTKILTGGAVALVAVLAFTFGNNLAANNQATVLLAQTGASNFHDSPPPPPLPGPVGPGVQFDSPKRGSGGSGGSGSGPIAGCTDSSACNYSEAAAKSGFVPSKAQPMVCHYAFYSQLDVNGNPSPAAGAEKGVNKNFRPIPWAPNHFGNVLMGITTYTKITPPGDKINIVSTPISILNSKVVNPSVLGDKACGDNNLNPTTFKMQKPANRAAALQNAVEQGPIPPAATNPGR